MQLLGCHGQRHAIIDLKIEVDVTWQIINTQSGQGRALGNDDFDESMRVKDRAFDGHVVRANGQELVHGHGQLGTITLILIIGLRRIGACRRIVIQNDRCDTGDVRCDQVCEGVDMQSDVFASNNRAFFRDDLARITLGFITTAKMDIRRTGTRVDVQKRAAKILNLVDRTIRSSRSTILCTIHF